VIPTINATASDIDRLSPQRVLVQALRLRQGEIFTDIPTGVQREHDA
jgi:hypothetical protein